MQEIPGPRNRVSESELLDDQVALAGIRPCCGLGASLYASTVAHADYYQRRCSLLTQDPGIRMGLGPQESRLVLNCCRTAGSDGIARMCSTLQ